MNQPVNYLYRLIEVGYEWGFSGSIISKLESYLTELDVTIGGNQQPESTFFAFHTTEVKDDDEKEIKIRIFRDDVDHIVQHCSFAPAEETPASDFIECNGLEVKDGNFAIKSRNDPNITNTEYAELTFSATDLQGKVLKLRTDVSGGDPDYFQLIYPTEEDFPYDDDIAKNNIFPAFE